METDNFDDLKIILWLILFLVFGIIIITCKPVEDNIVMTVNGPVKAESLGMALEHEHILVDFTGADSIAYSTYDRNEVVKTALPFIESIKAHGVNAFFECTPAYLGRDPVLLRQLSEITGMHFITNTGFYGAVNDKYIPNYFLDMTAREAADKWTYEYVNGIDGTGIKPGFIKIAVNPDDSLSPLHRKIITAAGLAHLETGLTIASHTGPEKPAFEQLAILNDLGIDPSAFIWVHAQRGSDEGILKAAAMGAWISLDNVRNRPSAKPGDPGTVKWYADRISLLREKGFIDHILLSHDSGWYDPKKPGGGTFNGFTDLFGFLVPELKERGFSDDDIDQILVRNPAKAFTIKIRTLK